MKTLLILRHAKSSWKDAALADPDRPLNKRGERDAPRMGELLREEGLVPDLIISSTALRARMTTDAAAESCGYEGKIQLSADFYPGDPDDYVQTLRLLPPVMDRVMVVGHNPGLEELVEALTGDMAKLPTAALALVRLPIAEWAELSLDTEGVLENLWLPRAI